MGAKENCVKKHSSSLVSMETKTEWHFVKNLTTKHKQRKKRWFIGLRNVTGTHRWYWLSTSTAWVNKTSARWGKNEPNKLDEEKCVEMLHDGKYNNIPCKAESYDDEPGYICENQISK